MGSSSSLLEEYGNNITFDELETKHRSIVAKARSKRNKNSRATKNILLEKEYRFFKYVQQPRNRYELSLEMYMNYDKLEILIKKYERLGLVQLVDYNPNKYKITPKGIYVVHKIIELNNLMDKYVKKGLSFTEE